MGGHGGSDREKRFVILRTSDEGSMCFASDSRDLRASGLVQEVSPSDLRRAY